MSHSLSMLQYSLMCVLVVVFVTQYHIILCMNLFLLPEHGSDSGFLLYQSKKLVVLDHWAEKEF